MKTIFILLAILSFGARAVDMPSDDELLKKGRQLVGDVNPAVNQAQRDVDSHVNPSVSPAPGYNKGLTKDMVQEMMHPDWKKAAADNTKRDVDLIVFVSFSMPDDLLIEYSKQAKEAGATLVIRGLYQNSLAKTQMKAAPLNPAMVGYEINPGLFRKFKVNKVPSIVLVDSRVTKVLEDGCALPGAYIKVDGDVSIREALSLMRWQGEKNMADIAAKRLKAIERS